MLFRLSLATAAATGVMAITANAEVPHVAADILPVHSLVARVMADVGTPDLILPPGASPHGYAMRPSEAAALEKAEIVFWVGHGLTPWLEEPIETLAADAQHIELLEQDGTILREFDEDGGAHDNHTDHDHDHGEVDPHAWLDPLNAGVWVDVIAATLSEADPDNAATYADNAKEALEELAELQKAMSGDLQPLKQREFAVSHDALGYLETRFGVAPALSILSFDAQKPGPQRIAELRSEVRAHGINLVFSEPLVDDRIIETVFEGLGITVCEIDPLGGHIPAGPNQYWQYMADLSQKMGACGEN